MDSQLTTHAILFAVMTLVYRFFPGGFENHFTRSDNVKSPPTLVDVIYFTTTTHATVGYGDIVPKTQLAKITTSIHMILVFICIIMGISFGFGELVKFIRKRT